MTAQTAVQKQISKILKERYFKWNISCLLVMEIKNAECVA